MGAPLIFMLARRIARKLKRAVGGGSGKTNSRRNVASKLADPCARELAAVGKTIHSARASRGRKLIPGSLRAIHARIDGTTATNATIKIARPRGLWRANIAGSTFSTFGHCGYIRDWMALALRMTSVLYEPLASTFDRTFSDHCVSHHTV